MYDRYRTGRELHTVYVSAFRDICCYEQKEFRSLIKLIN